MRRTLTFVALWLLAGAAATTIAWLGVSSVSDELAGNAGHPDPLSAEEITAEVAAGASSSTTVASPTTQPTTTTVTGPGSTTSTTGPTATTTPTTAPNPPASTTTIRSYDLVGGNVTLRFSPSGVTVVVATPAPGFTVELGDSHSSGAKVEFEGEGHKSQVEGWWDGGPQDEVREDGDDD